MEESKTVRTRILVLSDTHGMDFASDQTPLHEADVLIHCGDLTDESKISEFRTTIDLLKRFDAPLKLVIPGNHDFTMDLVAFDDKVKEAGVYLEPELIEREYGLPGEAQALFQAARGDGIVLLDEGTRRFELKNGAALTVFASPYTPALGTWGFQYHPNKGRAFNIEEGTDIVITHGPPKGIMDYTQGRERAGCPILFTAVAKARPRLHCFGHIHEGWGAKLVTWKDQIGEQAPTHFTAIDNEKSHVVERLSGLRPSKFDSPGDARERLRKHDAYKEDRCCRASNCPESNLGYSDERQTLFVNASISGSEDMPVQKPWLVDIDLPKRQGLKEWSAVYI